MASPKLFMSMASLLTKCIIFSTTCASHSILMQRQTASPSSLNSWLLQTGHCVGKTIAASLPVLASTILFTICGITSPALSIKTASPICNCFSFIYSSLCIEILLTVTPPKYTGCSFATGVTAPVLPTWYSTDNNLVVACLALNLKAIAQRG